MRNLALRLGCVLLLLAPTADAWAQATVKRVQMRPIASVKGYDVYTEYCVACHGEDLTGHGPDAVRLVVPPADLTTIATRHGGKFKNSLVADDINRFNRLPKSMTETAARERAMSTGQVTDQTQPMPLFGPIFAILYPQEARDRQIRMANLLAYIKSKQVKG